MSLGVKLVIAYKWTKGVAELAIGALLALDLAGHPIPALEELARHHFAPGWAVQAFHEVTADLGHHGPSLLAGTIALDGALALFEGAVLYGGRAWGVWVVVLSSGSFLPLEVGALFERPSPVRAATLALNVAVVAYLAARIRRKVRTERRATGPVATSPGRSGKRMSTLRIRRRDAH